MPLISVDFATDLDIISERCSSVGLCLYLACWAPLLRGVLQGQEIRRTHRGQWEWSIQKSITLRNIILVRKVFSIK